MSSSGSSVAILAQAFKANAVPLRSTLCAEPQRTPAHHSHAGASENIDEMLSQSRVIDHYVPIIPKSDQRHHHDTIPEPNQPRSMAT